jgi:peptide-methionine (S)-S-oxide reductase
MLALAAILALFSPASPVAVPSDSLEEATLGAGCFWCAEAVFDRVDGVEDVIAGFADSTEVARIVFNPNTISYGKLLEVFWLAHDPTTLDRQGGDVGHEYRSVIYYHTAAQKATAENSLKTAQAHFNSPIVTAIEPLPAFVRASDYHQDFYRKNPDAPYCRFVITPKLESLHLKLKGE